MTSVPFQSILAWELGLNVRQVNWVPGAVDRLRPARWSCSPTYYAGLAGPRLPHRCARTAMRLRPRYAVELTRQPSGAAPRTMRGRRTGASTAAAVTAATSSTAGQAPMTSAITCESAKASRPAAAEQQRRPRPVAAQPETDAGDPADGKHDAAERTRAGGHGDGVAGDQARSRRSARWAGGWAHAALSPSRPAWRRRGVALLRGPAPPAPAACSPHDRARHGIPPPGDTVGALAASRPRGEIFLRLLGARSRRSGAATVVFVSMDRLAWSPSP